MKVLVDADLIVCVYLNEGELEDEIYILWKMFSTEKIKGYLPEDALRKIDDIISNFQDSNIASDIIFDITDIFRILPTDKRLYKTASKLNLKDFESALEVAYAINHNIGAIVTLNHENFDSVDVQILSVNDLVNRQSLESNIISIVDQGDESIIEEAEKHKISLSQWMRDGFRKKSGWELADDLYPRLTYNFRGAPQPNYLQCKFYKNIHLQNDVILCLGLDCLSNNFEKFNINIKLHSINHHYLPNDSQLLVYDHQINTTLIELNSLNSSKFLECSISTDIKDEFSIKFFSGTLKFSEKFTV